MPPSRSVTAVVPTANRPGPLRDTLGAVLAQRDVDLRVIVVDDADDPVTQSYLADLGDPRVTSHVHQRPQGAAVARNTGLAAVETEWVAFCDDDDLWAPTKLAAQLDAVEREGTAWSCTGAVSVDDGLRIVDHQRAPRSGDVLDQMLIANVVPGGGSSVLARTELVRAAAAFDPDTPASEDWDLWIRLAERCPVTAVDEPLVGYRVWAGSKSRNTDRLIEGFETIEDRYADLASSRGVRPDWRRHRRWLAKQQVRSGDRRRASSTFAELARAGRKTHWPRAVAAMVAPGLMDRIGTARAARQVPENWRLAAESWLAELRPAEGVAPGRDPQPTG